MCKLAIVERWDRIMGRVIKVCQGLHKALLKATQEIETCWTYVAFTLLKLEHHTYMLRLDHGNLKLDRCQRRWRIQLPLCMVDPTSKLSPTCIHSCI